MNNISSFKTYEFIEHLFSFYYPDFFDVSCNENILHKELKDYCDNLSLSKLHEILLKLKSIADDDLEFYFEKDPAMKSYEEIVITNSAFRCIEIYRFAHEIKDINYLLSRKISLVGKEISGIDIAVDATIDHPFFIDHGVGTVIGQTAVVGKRVSLYQCVTLGARSLKDGRKLVGIKRHPTIEDDVTMYSYSAVFGDITIKKGRTIKAYEVIYKNSD